jgi:hypothetical protein
MNFDELSLGFTIVGHNEFPVLFEIYKLHK